MSKDATGTGPLVQGRDFYHDALTGYMVLTAYYLAQRGYCCGQGCRHSPYRPRHGGQ
ncbi:MAG: DUF5522 domain-containing protein, partial [Oligoflexus sp.]